MYLDKVTENNRGDLAEQGLAEQGLAVVCSFEGFTQKPRKQGVRWNPSHWLDFQFRPPQTNKL